MVKKTAGARKQTVSVRIEDPATIAHNVREMRERIAKRAFEIFEQNGDSFDRELDNWLAAEGELFWQPQAEFSQTDDAFTIEATVAGIDPTDLDVQVTPNDLLIRGASNGGADASELVVGELFRQISFPAPIDPGKVKAAYKNGVLHVTAPIAERVLSA